MRSWSRKCVTMSHPGPSAYTDAMRLFWGTLFVSGGVALSACSSGTEVAATFSSQGGGGPGSSGEGAASPVSSSSSSEAASSGASSSAASSSGSGQGGGGGAGGSECSFTSSDSCLNAVELPSIHGDTDSDMRTKTGTTSAWFKVLVTEDSNLIKALSYTATLVSPPGFVFELFAYEGNGSVPDCLGDALLALGNPPSVSGTWSDKAGSEDQRWISLEVRYISGQVCEPAPEWTLTVQGHTM
jgi:hypothetical protein